MQTCRRSLEETTKHHYTQDVHSILFTVLLDSDFCHILSWQLIFLWVVHVHTTDSFTIEYTFLLLIYSTDGCLRPKTRMDHL